MTRLLDLSEKVDVQTVRLFEVVTAVASSLGTPFFLVGAAARDIILELGFGIPSGRATKDIDFGVRVGDWSEFQSLKAALVNTGQFAQARETQGLVYRGQLLVDIVPFGGIADADRKISWPPKEDVVMSTVGFEEAYEAALRVRIGANPPLEIMVPMPQVLVQAIQHWVHLRGAKSDWLLQAEQGRP